MLRMEGIFVDVFVYEDVVIVADARMSSVISELAVSDVNVFVQQMRNSRKWVGWNVAKR
jgi:hypothetical protein